MRRVARSIVAVVGVIGFVGVAWGQERAAAPRLTASGNPGEVVLTAVGGKLQVSIRLEAVTLGREALPIQRNAAPIEEKGGGVVFDRAAGVLESYAPVVGGIEQSFRVDRPAGLADGTLSIDASCLANGAPAAVSRVDGGGLFVGLGDLSLGLQCDEATVIDARGVMFPASLVPTAKGIVRIQVSAETVRQAAWPIVVDPFFDFFQIVNASSAFSNSDRVEPDAAFDTFTSFSTGDNHLVVWRDLGSTSIQCQLVTNPNVGITLRRVPVLANDTVLATNAAGRPRAAFLDTGTSASAYGVVYATLAGSISALVVDRRAAISAGPISITTNATPGPGGAAAPAIGADPVSGRFLIVWEEKTSDINIMGRTMDATGALGPIFMVSKENVVQQGGATTSNQRNPGISARPLESPTTDRAWAVVYEDDALGASNTDIVCCFVPVKTPGGPPLGHLDVSNSLVNTLDAEMRPDVVASNVTNFAVALITFQDNFNGADEDIYVSAVSWDGVTATLSLNSPQPVAATTDLEEFPSLMHRFLQPMPPFMGLYDSVSKSAASAGQSFVHAFEIGVSINGDPFVLSDLVISRNFGRQLTPRGQFTTHNFASLPAVIDDALVVRASNDLGNYNILAETFVGAIIVSATNFNFAPDEDFGTPNTPTASIPGTGAGFPWRTTASNPWTIQPFGILGKDDAEAGTNGTNSTLSVTVDTAAAGFITFLRATNLNPALVPSGVNPFLGSNTLFFSIDGVRVAAWTGARGIAQAEFAVPTAGTHTFTWTLAVNISPTASPLASIARITFPPLVAPAISSVIAAPNPVVLGQAVSLTANVAGVAQTFQWAFGDATSATLTATNAVSHKYAAAGTFPVSLTITGPGGSDTRTNIISVTVAAPPPPSTTGGTTTAGTTTAGTTTAGTTTAGTTSTGSTSAGQPSGTRLLAGQTGGGGGGCAFAGDPRGGFGGLLPAATLIAGLVAVRRRRRRT